MTEVNTSYEGLLRDIEDFYDRVGPKYKLIYPDLDTNNLKVATSLLSTFHLGEGARVADLGCGSGWLLREFARLRPDLSLYGFDVSRESIQLGLSQTGGAENIKLTVADWLSVGETADGPFDLAVCVGNSFTLFPVELQARFLAEFAGLLKEGGSLVIDCYKDWNAKFKDEFKFEPRGMTRSGEEAVACCFFSEYRREMAVRHICFTYYDLGGTSAAKPASSEHYVAYQFPFILSMEGSPVSRWFSSAEVLTLKDELEIFDYYKLTK